MGRTIPGGGKGGRLRPLPAGVRGLAAFSGDDPPTRRHELLRWWGSEDFARIPREDKLMVIGHNPSMAGSLWNDPTTMTLMGITRKLGYRMLSLGNLSDWIATKPEELAKLDPRDLSSHGNIARVVQAAKQCDRVIAAWGNLECQGMADLGEEMIASCKLAGIPLHAFGINDTGHPRHALYLSMSVTPFLWRKA